MRYFLFLLTIFLASCASTTGPAADSVPQTSAAADTARYKIEGPRKGTDVKFVSPTITFDKTKAVHMADFGVSTTRSSYGIHDTLGNSVTGKSFGPDEPALVDISMLKPGRYEVFHTAIGEGVTYSIFIK